MGERAPRRRIFSADRPIDFVVLINDCLVQKYLVEATCKARVGGGRRSEAPEEVGHVLGRPRLPFSERVCEREGERKRDRERQTDRVCAQDRAPASEVRSHGLGIRVWSLYSLGTGV